jgi:hypothetical protein
VETRLVIEKGIWDDTFPLEGGGHVRMKVQFVLSEADRHRIRLMVQLLCSLPLISNSRALLVQLDSYCY